MTVGCDPLASLKEEWLWVVSFDRLRITVGCDPIAPYRRSGCGLCPSTGYH
jgi:hypothetical protein